MRKNTLIIVSIAAVALLVVAYFFMGSGEKSRTFSWNESYRTESDQPYGTLFIRKMLEGYRPGEKFILNTKTTLAELFGSDSIGSADYVFIGNELYLSYDDRAALLAFIAEGNDAFVATRYLPVELTDSIFLYECENEMFLREHSGPTATFNFYHETLQVPNGYVFTYRPGRQKRDYNWMALQPDLFCDSVRSIVPLGYFNNHEVNFFKMPYGNGNLYVHTDPIAFTNYFMRTQDKVEYASSVFSHLSGKTIIWDEFSKLDFTSAPDTNPLALIMKHDSLKYAWWMMLGTVLLYTVFTAKRKQRIVPVREEKANTSLEYVKMISALHFQNGNNRDIAIKKMKYFLYFIRSKYGIHSSNGQFTHDQLKRLSDKSQIDLQHVETLFTTYGKIEKYSHDSANPELLMNLYNAIDHFYKHCK